MGGFNCQLLFVIWFTIKQYTEKPQRRTDCATGIPFGHHASKAHWLAMICVLSPQKGNLIDLDVIARRAKPDVAIRSPFGNVRHQSAKRNTDCHTSDIGHWFAMTRFS